MREFGQIRTAFWHSPDIKGHPDSEKLLAAYLIAGPHTTALGCFRCPVGYIAADLEWGLETVSERLRNCSERVLIVLGEHDWVLLPRFLHHNTPQNPNQWRNVERLFGKVPESSNLLPQLADAVLSVETVPEGFRNRLETVRERFRNKDKDKDKEREKEKEKNKETGQLVSASLREPNQCVDKSAHRASEIREVFDHYRTHHPRAHKKPSPGSKEWKLISARLGEGYTVDDLRQAIDGCHSSPYNLGENEQGRQYLSLELIVRNGSKVQQYMEALQKADGPVASEKERRTARAIDEWVSRGTQGAGDD